MSIVTIKFRRTAQFLLDRIVTIDITTKICYNINSSNATATQQKACYKTNKRHKSGSKFAKARDRSASSVELRSTERFANFKFK